MVLGAYENHTNEEVREGILVLESISTEEFNFTLL